MVLGASLGTFAAAAVAGIISVEDALTAVIQQAMVLEEHCDPGGMTAILAPSAMFSERFLSDHSDLAAVNFPSHFVISARRPDLTEIEAALKQRNINYQRLPVSFAFHSRWIESAKDPFGAIMRSISFQTGRLPLVCCQEKTILWKLDESYFWSVLRYLIRFQETITQLEQQGPYRYIDVGPSSTLATFLKYGLPPSSTSTIHPILMPFERDQKNLEAVLAGPVVHSCR
jgi:bacillaene synthase trans-acting acyltransferase